MTADEWFLITTLYVPMNLKGQRTLIRRYFPIFVSEAKREIRNISPEIVAGWAGRFPYVRRRLCRMAALLRDQGLSMEAYVARLRDLDCRAMCQHPTPALDAIICDHQATGWKTLSCFIRDCVQGHCFPIDRRVSDLLQHYGLPTDERLLVSLCRSLGRNPREVARMLYAAPDRLGKTAPPRDTAAAGGVEQFIDNEDGYLRWVERYPGGFVVNSERKPRPSYLMLHRATCRYIRTPARTGYTRDYIKTCSTDRSHLEDWAQHWVGGVLSPCKGCDP